ncbi:MAG: hypothetical protein ACJ8F1_06020 [Polyangia bacterium]|jgi:hypothetical protein
MAKTQPRPQPVETVVPARNFTMTVDDRIRAYTLGVPGYVRRRRRIEDLEAHLVGVLAEAEAPGQTVTSRHFTENLAALNDLIARHNRYYPIEARLPIEVRTGQLLDRGVPWRPLPPVTAADLLARARG